MFFREKQMFLGVVVGCTGAGAPKPPLPKGRWPAGPEGFVARRATAAFGGNPPVAYRRQPPLGKGAFCVATNSSGTEASLRP